MLKTLYYVIIQFFQKNMLKIDDIMSLKRGGWSLLFILVNTTEIIT